MYANIYYNGSLDRENIHGSVEEIHRTAKMIKADNPNAEICVWRMDDASWDAGRGWNDDDSSHITTYIVRMTIRQRRTSKGLTQKQLAGACGTTQQWVTNIETGKIRIQNLTLDKAALLARALGVSMEELAKAGANDP